MKFEVRNCMKFDYVDMWSFGQICRDPIPLPKKVRMPLMEVREIDLHVEHQAADRGEFDKKVKEKELMYKRCPDEAEYAKMLLRFLKK
ncbi:hypothetical protein Hanom_Chr02g00164681 [Helianthus anomalus]